MIPETDNNFMIETFDPKFIYLRSIRTGVRQILVSGSPDSLKRSPCVFFIKREDGIELHFCTKQRDKEGTIYSWYRWNIGKYLLDTLRVYGRLPLELNIEKLMRNIKKIEDLELQLKKEREEFSQQLSDKTRLSDSQSNLRCILETA